MSFLSAPVKPTPEIHSCTFAAFVRSKASGNLSHVRLACSCWTCPTCVEKILKPRWSDHLAAVFSEHVGPLYRLTCDVADWERLYMRLYRLDAKYARVRLGQRYVIYSSRPIGEFADQMDVATATVVMQRDISSVSVGQRSVSTSRGWGLDSDSESKYTVVTKGGKRTADRAFVEVAKKAGLAVRLWKVTPGSAVVSGIEAETRGWADDALLKFIADVQALTAPERLCKSQSKEDLVSYSTNSCIEPETTVNRVPIATRWTRQDSPLVA